MFDFLRKSRVRTPSAAIRQALEVDGLPPGTDISALRLINSSGTFAGRGVTYFRVFDPASVAAQSVDLLTRHAYKDLNGYPDLVLRAGFIEQDGSIVVYARPTGPDTAPNGPHSAL